MPAEFSEIQTRAMDLQASYSERNTLFEEQEDMFFLEWGEESKATGALENVKVTLSPDPRNQLMGAVRLLVAGDPVFSIPQGLNDPSVQAVSDDIEKFVEKMWQAAGKIAGRPVHYDAALSAMLYGEVHIAIVNTDEIVKAMEGRSPAMKARAEKTAMRTPYLFEVWNPKECFTEFDNQGMITHYRRTQSTKTKIWSEFGDDALQVQGKGYEEVILCEWWDLENHVIWVESGNSILDPIVNEEHGLPFIPIVAAITDGSTTLFSDIEKQRQPFLYAVGKSGLWNRQNLSLTVMYTMLHGIGANPMFLYRSSDPDHELDVNWDVAGGYAQVGPGEEFSPLAKQIIDPNLWQSLDMANQLTAESTIYKQTLGEPLGKNAPFSMVALLSQSGRLPLIAPQRILGWALGSIAEMALNWMKEDSRTGVASYQGEVVELTPDQIPEDFEIEANLDVNMPQDDLQNANIARMLTEGEEPLVSQDWVREKILKIEQPSEMVESIWKEKAANLKAMQYFSWQLVSVQQQMEQAMQPPAPPAPPGGMNQPGGPGGPQPIPQEMPPIPPEGGVGGPEPGVQPGLDELPPEMAQGGMQGPMPAPGAGGPVP
jgi:hypothetical protein